VRHDHGSQYTSHHFQTEIAFLGIESSPAFVRAPEGNGCAERFIHHTHAIGSPPEGIARILNSMIETST
jgi:transposase InsO family protein